MAGRIEDPPISGRDCGVALSVVAVLPMAAFGGDATALTTWIMTVVPGQLDDRRTRSRPVAVILRS